MDDRIAEPGWQVQVREVQAGTAAFEEVRIVAARVLAQDRYLVSRVPQAQESHVLGAFDGTRCAGFLRYLIQVIGAEAGRPAVIHNGEPLREGYVEAFGVDPQRRRRGIGTALQQQAAQHCQAAGCYQMRSRSPVTSTENYALKIAAGYVLHPSHENDSYYFLLRLLPVERKSPAAEPGIPDHVENRPHLVDMPVIARHQDRGALGLDHRHDQA